MKLVKYSIMSAYQVRYEPRPLYACRLYGLEEVDHSLSFQSLQLSMDTDERSSTTHTVTVSVYTITQQRLYILLL